ncbi:hypothetical protein PVAND_008556 [Polypedilum vanderplanki]|uniref:Uncharacterized protein n=1 Tax=Polypedilum vanderplanki TaxID=319348 RepID=A0A9J6C9Y5_POLVA|nr:hypothetical protein PVAND_008556 [Polypedilum vanderplanki]
MLFIFSMGNLCKDFYLGVFNQGITNCHHNFTNQCSKGKFSCEILNNLNDFNLVYYENQEKINADFSQGKISGFILVNSNFTEHLENILNLLNSFVIVTDPSNFYLYYHITFKFYYAFLKVVQNLPIFCDIVGTDCIMKIEDIITNDSEIKPQNLMIHQSVIKCLLLSIKNKNP